MADQTQRPIEERVHGAPVPAAAGFRRDIQGLRAVAVLLVVAFHAGLPLSGGFVGVDLFFVISGFVITGVIWRQVESPEGFGFRSFYTRRARRLLPALSVLLVAVAVLSPFLLSPLGPQQATAKTGVAAALFSANLQLGSAAGPGYFGTQAELNALLHTWSLSVEEQFYFVFPAFLVGAAALARRRLGHLPGRGVVAGAVGAASLVSFVVSWVATAHPVGRLDTVFAFYSPVTRAWEFGVGVVLALVAPWLARLPARAAAPMALAGAALVAVSAVTFSDGTLFPGVSALVPVAGGALLVVAGIFPSSPSRRVLGVGPMVWIGDVSYGWYLWHWPLIVFAAALWPRNGWVLVLAGVVALVPTWLSYRFVENPIRFDRRVVGRRVLALAAVCITVPVVAFAGLSVVNVLERRTETVQAVGDLDRPDDRNAAGCDDAPPLSDGPMEGCYWSVPDPLGTIVLVGDSNAAHLAGPVVSAGNEAGYDVWAATRLACPLVDLTVRPDWAPDSPERVEECARYVEGTRTYLAENPPSLVVLASSGAQYVNNGGRLIDGATGAEAATPSGRAELWEGGVRRMLEELTAAGVPVVLVAPVPQMAAVYDDWGPGSCAAVLMFTDGCEDEPLARSTIDRRAGPAREAEEAAAAGVDGVTLLDVTDELCTAEQCPTYRDGRIVYHDGAHLSLDGAMLLHDDIAAAIDDRAVPAG